MAAILSSPIPTRLPARGTLARPALAWIAFIAVLVVAPLVLNSSASVSLLSRLGALAIFCMSYNMLFGQAGMLSFGHSVYSGLGGYFAIHAMNQASGGGWPIPLPLIPLVGGLAGAFFGVLFGYLTTRKSGTTFAMITLGLGELVHAMSQMLPHFFGGEGGITTNRTYGTPFLGLTFGPQIQVYGLICLWLLLCTAAMYALTRTPLGRIANAVRDNPERVEFIGYDTRRVRFLVLIIAAFFAGVSGGLTAINFEVVSSEALSAVRSGDALVFTFMGGAGSFVGPIIGAITGGFLTIKLSDFTMAWQFYLGAAFMLFVMFAPSGIAGIAGANWQLLRAGRFGSVWRPWLGVAAAALCALAGLVVLTELSYARAFAQVGGLARLLAPLQGLGWAIGAVLLAGGSALFSRLRRQLRTAWDQAMTDDAVPAVEPYPAVGEPIFPTKETA